MPGALHSTTSTFVAGYVYREEVLGDNRGGASMKIKDLACDLMPQISFVNLLIVAAVALLAPLLIGYLPRLRLPAVVVEIAAGVVLGPSVLAWVQIDLPVQILAVLGLAFLLFLAGLEIDLRRLRGRALRFAVLGYGLTLVLGVAVGAGLGAAGWTMSPVPLAIALSATSLGLVVPVLKDAGQADSLIGQTIIASATVADFAAIVLLTLFSLPPVGVLAQRSCSSPCSPAW
jgi:Kef-type K+ transport system membrane component KefB